MNKATQAHAHTYEHLLSNAHAKSIFAGHVNYAKATSNRSQQT